MEMAVSLVHPPKVSEAISFKVFGRVTVDRFLQLRKDCLPVLFRESPRLAETNDWQPSKVPFDNLLSEFDKVTAFIPDLLKASGPILSIELGRVTVPRLSQYIKACLPIILTVEGILGATIALCAAKINLRLLSV